MCSEYPNMKIWRKFAQEKVSQFKNINSIATRKLISKISFIMHLPYQRDHTFMMFT